MPLSEWSRRSKNECPWPARNGGTLACALPGPVGLAVVATEPLMASEMTSELFIILVREKGSQGTEFAGSGLLGVPAKSPWHTLGWEVGLAERRLDSCP